MGLAPICFMASVKKDVIEYSGLRQSDSGTRSTYSNLVTFSGLGALMTRIRAMPEDELLRR